MLFMPSGIITLRIYVILLPAVLIIQYLPNLIDYYWICTHMYIHVAGIVLSFLSIQIAELSDMRDEIMSRVGTAVEQAARYRDSYNEYAYLWVDDRKEFLNQFLKYGHVLTQVNCSCSFAYTYTCRPIMKWNTTQVCLFLSHPKDIDKVTRE